MQIYGKYSLKNHSPDRDPIFGGPIKRIARLDVERLVNDVEIRAGTIRPIHCRRVRIGQQAVDHLGIAILALPALGPTKKEALSAREAIDLGSRLAVERQ